MNHKTKLLLLIFFVALTVRLATLAVFLPKLKPDVDLDSLRSLARNVAAGRGFLAVSPDGRELPNVGRTPLYPLFLAGLMKLGGDRLAVFLTVQCVLWGMICVLTVIVAARWLSWNAAAWAGLIVALDPNCVTRSIDLRTETLFALLLLAGVCLLAWHRQQPWGWFWAGVLWSLATLCRPIATWLWIVALILALVWRARWAHVAVFVLGFFPLIGLWAARNAAVTGRWIFATNATDNLLVSWAAGVEAAHRGISVEAAQQELVAKVGRVEYFDDRDSFAARLQNSARLSREILLANPGIVLREAALGWAKLLLGPGGRTLEPSLRQPEPPARWWLWSYSAALGVLLILSVIGLAKLGRSAFLPGIVLFYFVALAGGPVSYSRYRVPITPLLAILAMAGCTTNERDNDLRNIHHSD